MSAATYVFAGGGTGGHLFPGIAIAERLVATDPDARIVFLGTDRRVERDILAGTDFEHQPLTAGGQGHVFQVIGRTWKAYCTALDLLRNSKPTAVIGCGGGESVATVVAARRLGVPVLLLEQNVIPGRATRLLSRLNTTVCLTYSETASRLPRSARTVVTGNPVRQAFTQLAVRERTALGDPTTRTLMVLGGSQGAHSINDAMLHLAQHHHKSLNGWRIVHQTGHQDAPRVRTAYEDLGVDATVQPFFNDIVSHYRDGDLVISRAGGTTLSELACAGLPTVLVPYPHARDDHQTANATVFADTGAAVIVQSKSSNNWQTTLATEVSQLLTDDERRETMSQVMRVLARPRAAEEIVSLIRQLSRRGRETSRRTSRDAPHPTE